MKTVCLGGDLKGFASDHLAPSVADLEDVAQKTETVVLVCHGSSPYRRISETEVAIDPELLSYDLHAVALTHRGHSASAAQLAELKKDLAPNCQRVFGLTRGWDTLEAGQRAAVISFLESNETAPADPDVQALLGYDSPVSRLALRVALEIALRELEGGIRQKAPAAEISANALLSPALTVAEQEPSLTQVVSGIREALSSDQESLQKLVSRALLELRA
jgi:hypothetical protein